MIISSGINTIERYLLYITIKHLNKLYYAISDSFFVNIATSYHNNWVINQLEWGVLGIQIFEDRIHHGCFLFPFSLTPEFFFHWL